MQPHEAVVAALAGLAGQKIEGKKRLQKLLHLLQLAGADISTTFILYHYGPYSHDIAAATDFMSFVGDINEELVQVGIYDTYQSVFTLVDDPATVPRFSRSYEELLNSLDSFSTVQLEVASTIGYFLAEELSLKESVEKTRKIKPNKTIKPVIEKSKEIFRIVNQIRDAKGGKGSAARSTNS